MLLTDKLVCSATKKLLGGCSWGWSFRGETKLFLGCLLHFTHGICKNPSYFVCTLEKAYNGKLCSKKRFKDDVNLGDTFTKSSCIVLFG